MFAIKSILTTVILSYKKPC